MSNDELSKSIILLEKVLNYMENWSSVGTDEDDQTMRDLIAWLKDKTVSS